MRDIIYFQIPQEEINKAKKVINSQGYSNLELKTRKTRLVIKFKRIQECGSEESALKDAISQMRTHHYGETTEDIKLIRAAMIYVPQREASQRTESWSEKGLQGVIKQWENQF